MDRERTFLFLGAALFAAVVIKSGGEGVLGIQLYMRIPRLLALGFQRLGELRVGSARDWIFVDAYGTTWADVVPYKKTNAQVTFSSGYADDALVQTDCPFGERASASHFRSRVASGSLEEACQYHRQQAAEFGQEHGVLRRVETMDDYMGWVRTMRTRYGQIKHRRHFLSLAQVIVFGYALVVVVAALLAWPWIGMPYDAVLAQLQTPVLLLAPAVLVSALLSWFVW